MKRRIFLLLGCLAALAAGPDLLRPAAAGSTRGHEHEEGSVQGIPWRGRPGVTESVAQIMERQARGRAPGSGVARETHRHVPRLHPRQLNPSSPEVSQWPPADASISAPPEPLNPQLFGTSFKAVSRLSPPESPYVPPDSMGDVGPTQVLVPVNGRIKVFDKNGNAGDLNADLDVFFASAGDGSGASDPQVRYDRLTSRWFLSAISVVSPNRIMIAVSDGPTITNSTVFTFFGFQHDTDGFADYDSMGVDRFAVYIGTDTFDDLGIVQTGTAGFVINKADLLAGTLTVTVFRGMYPGGSNNGPDSPRGVDNDDPAAMEGYFIGPDHLVSGRLVIRRVTNPGGVPSISGNLNVTVPSTTLPLLVPHTGVPVDRRLDALDDRLFNAQIHTNKLTGVSSLWTAHNIQVNSSGAASGNGKRDGSRWYEIRSLTTTPTLFQAGTLFDPAPANSGPRYFWIPSVAMSGQGHMALGCSAAGEHVFVDVAVAGRLSDDPLGATQPFTLATSSGTAYLRQAVDGQRWGDYSQTVVDPTDDMTMWTFQEYCDETNSWGVQAIQLLAPPPATPSGSAPSSVCQGIASVPVTVTGTVTGGSGFFDPGPDTGGPGYANHFSASVTGGVAVNGVVFNSPTQVTLTLSTLGASPGAKNVTVTNPDGQSMTGTGLLTLTAQPASPAAGNNGPICAGGTLQLTASTVPGATYSWTGPNGFTSSQQNPSIPGATAAASGTYTVRATAAGCASAPAATAATVSGNGGACNDGNACTLGETCLSGVCQGGSPRDADADAHVDALCGGNDCNDTNPLVWFVPVEVTGLTVTTASPADPSWDNQGSLVGPGTTYDLVSGTLPSFGSIDFTSGVCLQSGGTSFSDTRPDPAVGSGTWYLARSRNSCGTGTYGNSLRDTTVPPCP